MENKESSKKPLPDLKASVRRCTKEFYLERGYIAVRCLGRGMTGNVMLARPLDGSSGMKALKIFNKRCRDARDNREMFKQEVAILQSIEHKFILGDITAFSDPDKFVLCMPYHPGGTLTSKLPNLTNDLMDKYLVHLTAAILYLRGRHLAHMDVKTDNVLISEAGNAILCDFGLACVVKSKHTPNPDEVGTFGYMAPELMDGTRRFVNLYKCDTYSLGVVLWCMMYRRQVDDDPDSLARLQPQNAQAGTFPYLLEHLLHKDPEERWNSKQLIRHIILMPGMKELVKKVVRE